MKNDDRPGCLGRFLQELGLAPRRARPRAQPVPPAGPVCLTAGNGEPEAAEPKPGTADPEPQAAEPEVLPFHVRDDFLSPAECSFYHLLQRAAGDWAVVCPKVSLADLFFARTGDYGTNTSYRNRIARKHVDFLLCDPRSMKPLLGIELDDASHNRADRQERDGFVDRVFAAAGLPLHRQRMRRAYDLHALSARLRALAGREVQATAGTSSVPGGRALQGTAPPGPAPMAEVRSPPCPKCGQPMVLRTSRRRGRHQGEQFWGCPSYPRCRGMRAAASRNNG
ncbi:MAG: DUF2726 domain-containing protein [Anaerolineaceae bacterium]|nr:DUF2726 domain-containing protein [Anaerolineaceae bacterium]